MAKSPELLREALLDTVALQDKNSNEYSEWLHAPRAHPLPLTIPAGEGTAWPVTQAALDKLAQLAEAVRADTILVRVVSRETCFQTCCRVFGEMLPALIEIEDQREAWKKFRTQLESQLNDGLQTVTHYMPVWLFVRQEFDDFDVGPVRFLKHQSWVVEVEKLKGSVPPWRDPVLQCWGNQPEALEGLEGRLKSDATLVSRFAGPEQRVAAVTVAGFHSTESSRRALLATRVALDALRPLVPANLMSRFATTMDHRPVGHATRFHQRSGTDLFAGISANRPGVGGTPGLAAEVLEENAGYRVAAGACIATLLEATPSQAGNSLPKLSERWCNAVHWFGRACVVDEDFAALPMCAIALDVLSGGLELNGIRKLSMLLLEMDEGDSVTSQGASLRKVVSDIYNARNHILHGSELVIDKPLAEQRAVAQGVTAVLVVRYVLQLADYKEIQEATDDRDAFTRWLGRS